MKSEGNVAILKRGLFSTIQDLGRIGFAGFGVPSSGPMDLISFNFANSLLDNDKNSACIEWIIQAPVLKFTAPTIISLTGAIGDAFLNEKRIKMYQPIQVSENDILYINNCKKGLYGYVGIKNGFLTPKVLGSRSFFRTITLDEVLKKEMRLPYGSNIGLIINANASMSFSVFWEGPEIKVFEGPEFYQLSDDQKSLLFNSNFTISDRINRMAIQLREEVPNQLPSMITSPVLPGTVQLTPSGKLIVLMRDCQTTGGYPRVLQLSEKSINIIAQKRMNEHICFELSAL